MSVYVRFGPVWAGDLGNSTQNTTKCPGGVQWMLKYLGACAQNPQEEASEYLGLLSMILWMTVGIPQIVKNFRNLDGLAGVSFFLLFQWAGGDITNLVGSLLTHQLPFQVRELRALFQVRELRALFQSARALSGFELRSAGHLSRALLSAPDEDNILMVSQNTGPLLFRPELIHGASSADNKEMLTSGEDISSNDNHLSNTQESLLGAASSFWHLLAQFEYYKNKGGNSDDEMRRPFINSEVVVNSPALTAATEVVNEENGRQRAYIY
ncbi:PQ-loop repeat-containing protein 2 [Elysia marginata]|uniref:PQ-loop repeat-containing protein 2 n=1 Tax=Elysia marginata TaxID=1093978 RepID=A0AAV4H838_9GAST|nr:PQ-loop repeat-containing protein 2 [Elysia marginata]